MFEYIWMSFFAPCAMSTDCHKHEFTDCIVKWAKAWGKVAVIVREDKVDVGGGQMRPRIHFVILQGGLVCISSHAVFWPGGRVRLLHQDARDVEQLAVLADHGLPFLPYFFQGYSYFQEQMRKSFARTPYETEIRIAGQEKGNLYVDFRIYKESTERGLFDGRLHTKVTVGTVNIENRTEINPEFGDQSAVIDAMKKFIHDLKVAGRWHEAI